MSKVRLGAACPFVTDTVSSVGCHRIVIRHAWIQQEAGSGPSEPASGRYLNAAAGRILLGREDGSMPSSAPRRSRKNS